LKLRLGTAWSQQSVQTKIVMLPTATNLIVIVDGVMNVKQI